jgi:acyl carrier protein
MSNNNTEAEILKILAKHAELDPSEVTPDTALGGIGIDSLKLVEIIYDLEERFDISIPDPEDVGQQSSQFRKAGDVVHTVTELMRQQGKNI